METVKDMNRKSNPAKLKTSHFLISKYTTELQKLKQFCASIKTKSKPMEQIKEPRNKHMHIWSTWSLMKVPRIHNRERTISPTNCVKKTGYSHAKEWNLTLILCHIHKSTQNGLTFKEEIRKYKTPKRKYRAKALWHWSWQWHFLYMTTIPQTRKAKQLTGTISN